MGKHLKQSIAAVSASVDATNEHFDKEIEALTARFQAYDEKLAHLESRLDATIKMQNLLLEAHGMEDVLLHDFTAQELKDANGFLTAYLGRRGAIRHLDLEIILTRIKTSHGGNGSGIDPALFGTVNAVPLGVTNADEAGETILGSHEANPAANKVGGQVSESES
ncbi:MAG: hypothetical protein ABIT37_03830 [Luteolibacter sp.]